jgi:hypothetical protein
MGRLIDADALRSELESWGMNDYEPLDFIEELDDAPTVEAIPKDQYENRLKADMVAVLKKLQSEIEKQCKIPNNNASAYDWNNGVYACYKAVQQKIDALKE